MAVEDNVRPLPKREGLRRGIYLLPNLITTGAFAGFYSIIAAMSGDLRTRRDCDCDRRIFWIPSTAELPV